MDPIPGAGPRMRAPSFEVCMSCGQLDKHHTTECDGEPLANAGYFEAVLSPEFGKISVWVLRQLKNRTDALNYCPVCHHDNGHDQENCFLSSQFDKWADGSYTISPD